MILGAHVSIAGGFDKCIDRIADLGGQCLMTFASSPRSLSQAAVSDAAISKYLTKKAAAGIGPHFFHGVYLVNLASDSTDYIRSSVNSLISYQLLAGQIGGIGTIFHIGSRKNRSFQQVIDQIVVAVNFILDSSPKGIRLILENAAGQGNVVGERFEELGEIIGRVGDRSKIGFCLDTQHCFAAGISLDTAITRLDKTIGLKHLQAIHLNDSQTDFGSRVDRHANLGEGRIGLATLKKFINDPRLKNTPLILEVPGDGKSGPRKTDIDTLKSLTQ